MEASIVLTGEGQVLNLPLPARDDLDNLNYYVVKQRTRGHELKLYRDENWPVDSIIVYTFETLTDDLKSSLRNFIRETLGKQIILRDYNGVEFPVFILTEQVEFIEERDCAHQVVLRFQKL